MRYLNFEHKKELRFGSRVSLRSYFVKHALLQEKGIKVSHGGKTMTLSVEDLKLKGVHNKNILQIARFSSSDIKAGETYYLIDFTFRPGEIKVRPNFRQQTLF